MPTDKKGPTTTSTTKNAPGHMGGMGGKQNQRPMDGHTVSTPSQDKKKGAQGNVGSSTSGGHSNVRTGGTASTTTGRPMSGQGVASRPSVGAGHSNTDVSSNDLKKPGKDGMFGEGKKDTDNTHGTGSTNHRPR